MEQSVQTPASAPSVRLRWLFRRLSRRRRERWWRGRASNTS